MNEAMFMACHHNAVQNHNIMTENKAVENMAKFQGLKTAVTNQNYIHEEAKFTLNPEKPLYSSLVSKNVKIKIF
jgi:hypothetical protein